MRNATSVRAGIRAYAVYRSLCRARFHTSLVPCSMKYQYYINDSVGDVESLTLHHCGSLEALRRTSRYALTFFSAQSPLSCCCAVFLAAPTQTLSCEEP